MASVSEKLKGGTTAATPHEIMETDPERLHMSYAQSVAKDRKLREIKAKLVLEKQRLEELAKQEEEDLIKAGQEDNVKKETSEEV